jgi:hypothetical protein
LPAALPLLPVLALRPRRLLCGLLGAGGIGSPRSAAAAAAATTALAVFRRSSVVSCRQVVAQQVVAAGEVRNLGEVVRQIVTTVIRAEGLGVGRIKVVFGSTAGLARRTRDGFCKIGFRAFPTRFEFSPLGEGRLLGVLNIFPLDAPPFGRVGVAFRGT